MNLNMTTNLTLYSESELNKFIGKKIDIKYFQHNNPKIDMFDENTYSYIRLLRPGCGYLTDYIENRLNIHVDNEYIITRIYYE
jgi:hypothetical protein